MRDTARKQTIYDVIIDATIHKLGGWKNVTPEDALKVSQEKSVLDTYNHVSAIFQVPITSDGDRKVHIHSFIILSERV